ncbi:MAG: hypothetical protein U0893_14320 [Chloroflexota bacterium]
MSRRWASVVLALLAYAMVAWTFQTGQSLGMADHLSRVSWLRAAYATAGAISRLEYGVSGYRVLRPVWDAMQRRGFVSDVANQLRDPNTGIADALQLTIDANPAPGSPSLYLGDWGDDKGYANYPTLAFALFGFRIQSFYYLYFLLLAISLTAFLVEFRHQSHYLAIAPMFLAAHHLAVLTLQDSAVTSTLHDARFLPALGCLASMHVMLLLVRRERPTIWSAFGLLVQIATIVLVVESRPSSIWLVYFPVGACLVVVAWSLVRRHQTGAVVREALLRSPIVLLMLLIPRLQATYHSLAYDPMYTSYGIESHVVWHALYMGLGYHPDAPTYGLYYGDAVSYAHGYEELMSRPELAAELGIDANAVVYRPERPQLWVTEQVGWRKYDQLLKARVIRFTTEHPRYVAEALLLYKPRFLAETILWQSGLVNTWPNWVTTGPFILPSSRHILDPFAAPEILIVAAVTVVVVASGAASGWATWIWTALGLFAASLLPIVLVAPVYYELQVVFAIFSWLFYAVLAALLVPTIRLLFDATHGSAVPGRRGRLRLAGTTAAVLVLVTATVLCRPLVAAAISTETATMPAWPLAQVVQDKDGNAWVVTIQHQRYALPDPETYRWYGGTPNRDDLPRLNDRELGELPVMGTAPTLKEFVDRGLVAP